MADRTQSRRAEMTDEGFGMRGITIRNALTIDVEDYFQVSAFAPYIPREQWSARACRVERNVDRILQMLDMHETCLLYTSFRKSCCAPMLRS